MRGQQPLKVGVIPMGEHRNPYPICPSRSRSSPPMLARRVNLLICGTAQNPIPHDQYARGVSFANASLAADFTIVGASPGLVVLFKNAM